LIQKTDWRQKLLKIRKAIPENRRKEAAQTLKDSFSVQGNILSFTPIGTEINLTPLNERLKKEGRLFLVPYESTLEVSLTEIDCILVPGLGFDKFNTRLGYGKGYYDRLLASAGSILTLGIGFKEQFSSEPLPKDPWDIPVQELLLF
jgi:5-formyltetrahydrofolate cyclo-ligase